jgi:hypothetical protein
LCGGSNPQVCWRKVWTALQHRETSCSGGHGRDNRAPRVCNPGGGNPEADRLATRPSLKEREFLCVAFSCAILQPRLGNLLRKYMPARTGLIVQRIRSCKQCRCSDDEDVEVLAHALISLSFDFGFIRPAILRQNRQQAKNLAKRAASLLSRSVLNHSC